MSDQLQDTLNPETPATPAPSVAETEAATEEQVETPAAAAAEEPTAVAAEPEAVAAAAEPAPTEAAAAEEPTAEAAAEEPTAEAAAEEPTAEAAPAEEPAAAEEPTAEAAPAEEPVAEAAEAAPAEAVEAAAEAAAPAAAEETTEETVAASGEGAPDDPNAVLDPGNQTPEMLALFDAMKEKSAVEGQVIGWNKGGYHVALGRVAAFCPVSQIEIGNPRSPKRYLDKSFKFHVIEIQKGGRRVVLSRADALKAERKALAAEVRSRLKPGTVHEGRVSSLTDFGAFVDVGGGIEGLVHVSEISRRRIENPKEALEVGQEVKVTVLKIEKGGQRISLSMKRLEEDPWAAVAERYKPGESFTGKILRKAEFGFFVEIEAGIEGLVHNSRLPLGATSDDEAFLIGNEIEGWIHEVDPKRRRLSLSLRPVATSNPWKGIEERYPEDTVVKGKVERLAPFGAFIELEPGLTGLLPFSALGNSPANPRKQFHPGKEVSVRVLSIDREKRRISLGTETSQAEGSTVDYREYKKRQQKTTSSAGMSAMAAAFKKANLDVQAHD